MLEALKRCLSGRSALPRALLAEAALCVGAAVAATRVLPFRRIAAFCSVERRAGVCASAHREQTIRGVARSVEVVARHLPLRAECLQQALAAQYMLRRRGIATVLTLGVRRNGDQELQAHAWLTDGTTLVIGGPAESFSSIAAFPPPIRQPAPLDVARPSNSR